ncbi:hypothetical protein ACPV4X_23150, partial [Vibrio owensii]|uniref:hypothetical protein n=1 Tax=Vibrio owensii TaxID=696485 RepID=UPI00406928AC
MAVANPTQQSTGQPESSASKVDYDSIMRNIGNNIIDQARGKAPKDPLGMIDVLIQSMDRSQDHDIILALEELRTDPEIATIVSNFEKGLNGELDLSKVAGSDASVADAGIRPSKTATENLIAYSDYISGSGTTVGGFVSGQGVALPELLAEAGVAFRPSPIDKIKKKLSTQELYLKNWAEQEAAPGEANITKLRAEERQRRMLRFDETFNINNPLDKHNFSPLEHARHRSSQFKTELLVRARNKKLTASSIFSKAGTGVKVAGAGFGIGQGITDIIAGSNKEAGFDKDFRIAQGTFALGSGIASVAEVVTEKISKKLAKTAGKSAGKAVAKKAARFAPVAGGIISMGLGVTNVIKNATAADAARKEGNHGRAAMFGVMSALDSVTVVLDAVSTVLDFIPGIGTAASFIVDLISTVVGLVSDLIGFFTEMVDTRTPDQKLEQAFDKYIDSDEFKKYVD